jgi:hypothetical protein
MQLLNASTDDRMEEGMKSHLVSRRTAQKLEWSLATPQQRADKLYPESNWITRKAYAMNPFSTELGRTIPSRLYDTEMDYRAEKPLPNSQDEEDDQDEDQDEDDYEHVDGDEDADDVIESEDEPGDGDESYHDYSSDID